MNLILTTIWLIVGTLIGYMLGNHFAPESLNLWASMGFIISLIIRFIPTVLGDVIDAF